MRNNKKDIVESSKNVSILSGIFGVVLLSLAFIVPRCNSSLTYFDTVGMAAVSAIIIACVLDYIKCNKSDYSNWENAINAYKVIILITGATAAVLLYLVDLFSWNYLWINDANHVNTSITAILSIFAAEEGAKSYFKSAK